MTQRQIKFRAWVKSKYSDGKMIYDHLDEYGSPKFYIDLNGNVKVEYIPGEDGEEYSLDTPNKDITLMQFTGLYDHNEKEIYEGDIVCMTEESIYAPCKNLVVENYYCDYYLRPLNDRMYICTLKEGCEDGLGNHKYKHGLAGEVIGNIHEHPYLLNKAE